VTPPIAVIDYGAGNLASVRKGLVAAGADVFVPAGPRGLSRAAGIVVPGVGHFAATAALTESWRTAIHDAVLAGRPLLGICLGQQWLFEGSDEAPEVPGLALLRGRCARLTGTEKVPHVGWNTVTIRRQSTLLKGLSDGSYAYFTHSYAAPVGRECVAVTTSGCEFASVVELDRVFGVQFHPEKSGTDGIRLLENFVAIAQAAA
jgi:imidazole glycerol-phosphate synthase subunit HisH